MSEYLAKETESNVGDKEILELWGAIGNAIEKLGYRIADAKAHLFREPCDGKEPREYYFTLRKICPSDVSDGITATTSEKGR